MRVVLDTNVLVSAFLRPHGHPARILRLILQGDVEIALDERILEEYREVLARPRFRLLQEPVRVVLERLRALATFGPAYPKPLHLPDPDDAPFLQVALSAKADVLITGNLRDYPVRARRGIKVLTPAEFVATGG